MAEAAGEPIGTGELARAVTLIREDIGRVADKLEGMPTKVEMEQRLAAAKELQDLKNALQDAAILALEDANRWLVRTVGAALVTALGTAMVLGLRVAGAV